MIKEPTVFILGAGASCPYEFPTGEELRAQIIAHHANDCVFWLGSQHRPEPLIHQGHLRAKQFVETFRKSSTRSIDLFLGRNPDFQLQGKLAIAFRILDAERHSKFREDVKDKQKDWYFRLFELLTDKLVKRDDYKSFCENKVSFITFNYDRSLEHFLYESLCNSFYVVSKAEITQQVSAIPFIHIFGQIAFLPWQKGDVTLEYGTPSTAISDMEILRKNLRIIYEEQTNPSLQEAQKLISEAKRVFFLGFGYAEENLTLLNIPNCLKGSQLIYGTALGATAGEINHIENLFFNRRDRQSPSRYIQDFDCLRLLREYL